MPQVKLLSYFAFSLISFYNIHIILIFKNRLFLFLYKLCRMSFAKTFILVLRTLYPDETLLTYFIQQLIFPRLITLSFRIILVKIIVPVVALREIDLL